MPRPYASATGCKSRWPSVSPRRIHAAPAFIKRRTASSLLLLTQQSQTLGLCFRVRLACESPSVRGALEHAERASAMAPRPHACIERAGSTEGAKKKRHCVVDGSGSSGCQYTGRGTRVPVAGRACTFSAARAGAVWLLRPAAARWRAVAGQPAVAALVVCEPAQDPRFDWAGRALRAHGAVPAAERWAPARHRAVFQG